MRALLCLLLVLPNTSREQPVPAERPTVGFVRSVSGAWDIQIGRRTESVKLGQALLAGAELRPRHANARVEIVRALDVDFPACADKGGLEVCDREFKVPDVPAPASLSARLKAAISSFFTAESTYATTMVRSSVSVLDDEVAVLADGRVNLSRVFKRVPSGTYRVQFISLEGGSEALEPEPIATWTAGATGTFPAPAALKPGLYLLTLPELRDGCWVLVAGPSAPQAMDNGLSEMTAVTAKWPLTEAQQNGLRRALLQQLARELGIAPR